MKDEDKTKEQLINELNELRRFINDQQQGQEQTMIYSVPEESSTFNQFSADRYKAAVSNQNEVQHSVGNVKKYHIAELIDIPLLQQLFDSFYELTGIMHALLDVDANILTRTGWTDICLNFHRICPQTECRCKQSDRYISSHLHDGPYVRYKCLNGLIDYATPIIVEGQHLGSIYLGQLLHEPPDEEYFRLQAQEFGFDKAAYIEALHQVKIIPEHQIEPIMKFYSKLGQVLASVGLERLRRIEAAEDRFQKAFHCNPDLMAISTLEEGRFIEINEAFVKVTGYEKSEIIGSTVHDLNIWVVAKERDYFVKQITEKGHIQGSEQELRIKNGETRTFSISGEIIDLNGKPHLLHTSRDITEKKRIEKEIARLDRLHLVGEMAASIGHEIRNPITSIRGFLQLLRGNDYYAKDRTYFDLMIDELDRANNIISEYLDMAKDKMVDLQPQYLNDVIKSIYPMIEADANYQGMDVRLDLGDSRITLIDDKEIRQMILNMARNGLEAMPPGGLLIIGTTVDDNEIVLYIKDSGHGLDPELLDKMGTPFVTTKEQGTGLGMAVCYSIANRHNARIDFETGTDGTTFFIRFPTAVK